MTDIEELRYQVAVASRVVGIEGVTRGPVGHVSARLEEGDFLIKARGPEEEGLEFATTRDIVRMDDKGVLIEKVAGLAAPAETTLHLAVYESRPEVNCVIHVHPVWVVALSAAGREILPIYGAYDPTGLRIVEEGIPEYESSVTVHTWEEGRATAKVMAEANVCVMRQHGIVVAGKSVEAALRTTLAIHELSRVNWLAAAVGEPRLISDEDRAIFRDRVAKSSPAPKRADGKSAFWHYVERRSQERPLSNGADIEAALKDGT